MPLHTSAHTCTHVHHSYRSAGATAVNGRDAWGKHAQGREMASRSGWSAPSSQDPRGAVALHSMVWVVGVCSVLHGGDDLADEARRDSGSGGALWAACEGIPYTASVLVFPVLARSSSCSGWPWCLRALTSKPAFMLAMLQTPQPAQPAVSCVNART